MLLFAALGGCGAGDDALEVSIGGSGISVSIPAVPGEEILWGVADLANSGANGLPFTPYDSCPPAGSRWSTMSASC